MALTSPPTAVAPFDSGYLSAGITAGATTITVSPIVKTVNGVNVKQGFDTTSGLAVISQGDYFERISFEGSSVNATTKVTTLTGVTRGLSVNSTTTSFSGGTGRIWRKGANITVVADASYFQSAAFKAVANTWTALQTFSSGVTLTGTTAVLTLNTLTSTQRDALTPAEGMMIKNSTTNTIQMYIGGAWVNTGTDATPNAANGVAGKFDLATLAEVVADTNVDATSGAINVIPVSLLKETSSGAARGNIPKLNASAKVDISLLATGTPDGTKFVRDDGTLQVPTFTQTTTNKIVAISSTTSSTVGASSTSIVDFDNFSYTIPANDLINGVAYEIEAYGVANWTSGNFHLLSRLGSTTINDFQITPTSGGGKWYAKVTLFGTAAAGASVSVKGQGFLTNQEGSSNKTGTDGSGTGSNNVATNGTLALKLAIKFDASNAGNSANCTSYFIRKISSSAF